MLKKSSKLTAAVLAVVMLLSLTACGQTADSGKKEAGDYKMVLILPGPINDQSWNATNYAGLVKSNEVLGTKMEYVENVQAADFESTFRNYAERGYDLIMAAGTQFDEAANKVAASYPDTTFCVVNGMVSTGPNVAPIFPKEYEASYIAALMAGEITKNGQFATIGGFPNKAMENLLDVYEKVAVEIAKERGIANAKAVRAYANSWDDVALGKQMAETMIDNGADVLFVYANQVGLGAIQAAKEKGVKFIGFSGDQTTIDPNTVVGSVVFDFETFYVWAVQKYLEGSLEGNKVHEAGIAENIFKPVFTANISKEIQDKVAAGMEKAKKGEIDFKAMFANK
ncbi:BMP family protein [Zhaonella formicivorans]|uniref:BMP family protein n=1 Tax=Zhaonella formicivorans TaxID=2528593 RepID=UPI0010DBDF72|nr:BMP family protein [Zhaonella formicivorans]